QMNGTAARGKVAGEPVVILDVAIGKRLAVLAFEFGEQITGHLAHDVDEHVEATAVRHAYNDFLDSVFAGMVDQFVHRDDEALAAFQREALLTHILGMQVTLEAFGIGKLLQYAGFTLGGKRGYSDGGFETFLDPALGGRIGNMHELGTDSSTIRIAQRLEHVSHGHGVGFGEIRIGGGVDLVQIGFGQAVEGRIEFGDIGALLTLQRVEFGNPYTQSAVGGDQRLNRDLFAGNSQIRLLHASDKSVGFGTLGKRLDNGGMRLIARSFLAVSGRLVLKLIEVVPPFFGNRTGILQVRFVEFLYVWGVATKKIRVR